MMANQVVYLNLLKIRVHKNPLSLLFHPFHSNRLRREGRLVKRKTLTRNLI